MPAQHTQHRKGRALPRINMWVNVKDKFSSFLLTEELLFKGKKTTLQCMVYNAYRGKIYDTTHKDKGNNYIVKCTVYVLRISVINNIQRVILRAMI